MKLTKLTLHHYRDLAPGTELVFSPSLNLVLGENGTGRTTLLELLATVLGSDFSGLIHEPFSLEYDLAFPRMDIHVAVRNVPRATALESEVSARTELVRLSRPPREAAPELEPSIEATLQLHAPESRLVVRATGAGLACEVDGKPAWKRTMQWSLLDRSVWTLVFLVAQYLEPAVKDRLQELLHRTFLLGPSRFDEALGAFDKLGTLTYAMEQRDGGIFPLGLMALPAWMPAWLRARVEQEVPADAIEFHHHESAHSFLARFVSLAGFATGTFRLEVLEKRRSEEGGRLAFGRFGFRFTRRDGSELTHAQLGHGQKRLLAFLYYLDVNADFVVADELANGLHPLWVEACLREFGGRQAFLTSQNPLVFTQLAFASAEELRASLLLCARTLREGRERRGVSQPTEAQAAALFTAHREGRVPLAELLRTHGLW
jgi:energy-coupling factor transporter ATP-binding protein EcfA2